MTATPLFEKEVRDPDLRSVRELRHGLRDALAETDLPPRLGQDLQLAVQEHATNLVRHGRPAPGRIRLALVAEGGVWSLRIEDDGGPFLNFDGFMALATLADRRTDPRTHGMGLKFIGTRFADNEYVPALRTGNPNSLTLYLPPRADVITRPLVMLVSEDPRSRRFLKRALREEFRLVDFDLPSRALRVIRSHQPDLIIADIDLSEMDGVAFRRELAREIDTDIVPFVFLAGDADEARIAEIDDLGYDDVLGKPPQPSALRGTVRRLIARSRRLREAFVAKATRSASYSIASTIPETHGPFRISAHVASASAGGGDLIHASELGDRLLLLVADVMGHGMAARFYAHGVTAYFRSIIASAEPDTPLETVMTSLSDALFDDPTFERTTVSAQLIELLSDGSVGISSAAHPFPLLMTPDLVRWVEVSGPLPALGPALPFPSKTLAPAPGTRFGFYTDGLYEIGALRRDPVAAGARLFDLFGGERETPLEGAAERIIARHSKEVGSLPDDASVLIVERV